MSEITIKTEKPDNVETAATESLHYPLRVKSEPNGAEEEVPPPTPAVEQQEQRAPATPERRVPVLSDTDKTPERTTSIRTPTPTQAPEMEVAVPPPTPAPSVVNIKPEPGIVSAEAVESATGIAVEEQLPDNFFDDLLQDAEEIGAAAMSAPAPAPPAASQRQAGEQQAAAEDAPEPAEKRIKTEPAAEETTTANSAGATDAAPPPPPPPPSADASTAAAVTTSITPPRRIKNEALEEGEVAAAEAEAEAPPPPPSDDFFDDLLVDELAQRIEHHQNEELEIKYADKLQELRQQLHELESTDADIAAAAAYANHSKSLSHKKKKSKKKSRKRSRSREHRSRSHSAERRQKRSKHTAAAADEMVEAEEEEERASTSSGGRPSRPLSVKAEFRQFAPGSVYAERLECLPVQFAASQPAATHEVATTAKPAAVEATTSGFAGFKRIKLERRPSKETSTQQPPPPPLDNEVELILTPKMKRDRAMQRAASLIKDFQRVQVDEIKSTAPAFTRFHYTATVRKLPQSSSYVTQQIYENRSPLHTVNNVSYSFNSHATRFNLQEWGLEALSAPTAPIAKLLGIDAETLSLKLQALRRLPSKLMKIKGEAGVAAAAGECVDETRSSFFTNAMTQTDPVTVTAGRQRSGHDVAVQVTPHNGDIATQTEPTAQPAETAVAPAKGANDDLPLMQLIDVLNENQLMALQDFAELISESGAAGTAMDMYRLRQRMLDIYKCAQLPSAMATAPVSVAPVTVPVPKTSPLQISAVYSVPPIDPRTGAPVSQKYATQQKQQPPPPQQQWQRQPKQGRPAYNRAPQNANQAQPHLQMQPQPYEMPQQQPAYNQRQQQQRQPAPNPNAAAAAPRYYGRGGMRR